jgi:hypothetical protein
VWHRSSTCQFCRVESIPAEGDAGRQWLRGKTPGRRAKATIDGSELSALLPVLMQSQAYVVNLNEAYDDLAA